MSAPVPRRNGQPSRIHSRPPLAECYSLDMFRGVGGQFQVAAWMAILAASLATASGQEGTEPERNDVDVAAHRLANEILDTRPTKQRLPLTSDTEHARTIDPVLTRGTPIWIHEELPTPPLTVVGGRVFSYSDHVYDPLDAPVLKIRTIDDDQVIPFLIRVVVSPKYHLSADSAITISLPSLSVFSARVVDIAAWVDSKPAKVSISDFSAESRIEIRVPLSVKEIQGRTTPQTPITVIVDGVLRLGTYATSTTGRRGGTPGSSIDPAIARLSRLEMDRDFDNIFEREQLQEVADTLAAKSATTYEKVLAVNSWVSNRLRYRESPATRSPFEALQDRSGDCDDYATLAVALLRAMEIPARRATGLLYDFDTIAAHAWVEVALPTRGGGLRWFIVDPTLAGSTPFEDRKAEYVQFKDRVLMYPLRPVIRVEGPSGRPIIDALLNWRKTTEPSSAGPREADAFIELVIEGVDRAISRAAEELAEGDLLFQRESASIAGSPYLIVDRPVIEKGSSRLQLRLENEERLVLDLVAENSSALESKADLETIDRMRAAHTDLNKLLFGGMQAHHNLELIFLRDHHSDRLQSVSLRCGRYLIEHYLDRVLKRLTKADLLTEEEMDGITAVADASGGKNLYLLQELARKLAISAEGATDE
jgi:transglutaminase-like putative cysteine protease